MLSLGGLGKFRGTGLECAYMDACRSPQAHPAHGGAFRDLAPPTPTALCSPGAAPPALLLPGHLACSLLEVASRGLPTAGPLLPPTLLAVWFGHQATADVTFTILLPPTLTWTLSGRALAGTFCHLDPGLTFLTFCTSSRLLTHTAADCHA